MVTASFKRLNDGNNGAASSSRRIKKGEIPGSICLMPISVGQEYHVGEKGFATLKLLLESNFSKIIIMVVDTLQAFTIMSKDDCSFEDAMRKAIDDGDEWIAWFEEQKRREPALAELPIEIIRWSIYADDAFQGEMAIVEGWERENFKSFGGTLASAATNFLSGFVRKSNRPIAPEKIALCFKNSIEYLKRETAIAIRWQSEFVRTNEGKTIFLAYPKEPNPVISFVLNKAESPYKLEVEMLVIRFNSPQLVVKKASSSTVKEELGHVHRDGRTGDEYVSSDSDGGSPPEPSFIEEMQAQLGTLRAQVGTIPVLQEQLQQTTAAVRDMQGHLFILYQTFMAGGSNTAANGVFILPAPVPALPPVIPTAESRPAIPPPASERPGTPPPTN